MLLADYPMYIYIVICSDVLDLRNLYDRFICHYLPILQRMSKEGISLINYDSQRLIAKTPDRSSSLSSPPIFILCDICYWCATYFDKTRIPRENKCPQCNANNNELTSFPIMPNETFIFDYDNKRGVELEFKLRRKSN